MRPMTLVFATERSEKGIKEALFARRTAALFDGKLVGKAEYLMKLIQSSLKIRRINDGTIEVTNTSDIPYEMTNGGKLYLFPCHKTVRIGIPKEGISCLDTIPTERTSPKRYTSMTSLRTWSL